MFAGKKPIIHYPSKTTVARKPPYKSQDKKDNQKKLSVANEDLVFVLSWFPQEIDLAWDNRLIRACNQYAIHIQK